VQHDTHPGTCAGRRLALLQGLEEANDGIAGAMRRGEGSRDRSHGLVGTARRNVDLERRRWSAARDLGGIGHLGSNCQQGRQRGEEHA
jgi:hypothetical protein